MVADTTKRNHRSINIERCETRIARTITIDECFRIIALRTDDPLIIVEVEQGRSANDALHISLIAERRALGRKDTNAD